MLKISWIIAEDNWMLNLVPELIKFRHEVLVNNCSVDCDFLIATERTMSGFVMMLHRKYPTVPLIVNNWDWYDYTDKTKGTYPLFIQLMKEAKEVWSGDMDTAKTTEKAIGVKSEFSHYICVLPFEWEGEKKDYGYVMMGARRDKNKRAEWFCQACNELDIPYKCYHPEDNERQDYINTLKNCSFLITPDRECGVTIPAAEAFYCHKPALSADNPGTKEMWGEDGFYYSRDDYEDFKAKIKWLWDNRDTQEVKDKVDKCYKIVQERFLPNKVAEKISERLYAITR
jgi:glycosyltransferase involved in cell wall biosynthesis